MSGGADCGPEPRGDVRCDHRRGKEGGQRPPRAADTHDRGEKQEIQKLDWHM